MLMLNFIDPQWEILFSFALLEENQKVRLGYRTAPMLLIMVQCLTKGHFRGVSVAADTEASTEMVSLTHWTNVSQ